MPISSAWSRIAEAGPAVVVLVGATLALLALPVLRRLAPRSRRHRGGSARLFLGLALLLAAAAIGLGAMATVSPGNVLQLFGVLALMLGLVGLGGLFVFDVVLPRLGIDVPSILRDLILLAVAVALGMGFLRLAGLDVFSIVTTSAVLTAVIGLALQSTIANVFGGLGLQLDRTLRRGEWIEVGSHVGKILEIGWRSTRIQTKDGDTVFVPNSELISKDVRNFARPVGAHRVTVRVGFHYRHPPNEVGHVLLAAIRGIPGVADHPAPECGPAEFAESAVVYALRYWITDFAHDYAIDEDVHARIWYAAQRAALEIPFPIRTLVSQHGAARARAAAEEHEQEEVLRLLETTEPFEGLEAGSRRRCARGIRRLEFGRGEHVLAPDEPADSVYLIDSGEVTVHLRSNGTSREGVTLRAGELVGRKLLPGHASCTAHSDVVLYRFDHRALGEVVAADPRMRAGLSAIAEARQTLFEAPSGVARDHGAPAPSARLLRLFRRTERNGGVHADIEEPSNQREDE
jgi:small-conductance mechanosensitive channel/CRP-like cAMP-binding protein